MGFRIIFCSILVLLLAGCAQVGALDGGPKDVSAPVPDTNGINPPFASLNVYPKEITIPFDEFIQLNNPEKNIMIVPTVLPKPTYKIKGKDFVIQFADSSLEANTTYAIYMNGAIKDVTEGNDSLMNYVFSTGNQIDSLTHKVVLLDAFKNAPVDKAIVGLYAKSDTLDPYKDAPKYFAETNSNGVATFNYMAKGTFEVFAFKSQGGLGKPLQTDPIAFKSDYLMLDTATQVDTLYLFGKTFDKLKISKKDINSPGKIQLVTTRSLLDATITMETDSTPVDFIRVNTAREDSVLLWFNGTENKAYSVKINWEDTTLQARLFLKKGNPIQNKMGSNINNGFIGRLDSLEINSFFPISSYDTTKWILFDEDSISLKIESNQLNENMIGLINNWKDEMNYSLKILPGGITDFYGVPNKDTLNYSWKRKPIYKLSNMILKLINRPEVPLIVQVLSGETIAIEQKLNLTDTLIECKLIEPTSYIVRVIIDENNNGIWDTGNYEDKIQPEKVIWFRDPIKLRPNWDSKINLKFKNL